MVLEEGKRLMTGELGGDDVESESRVSGSLKAAGRACDLRDEDFLTSPITDALSNSP